MDPVVSVQNKDFTRDGEEFKKVARAIRKVESRFALTIPLAFGKSFEELS